MKEKKRGRVGISIIQIAAGVLGIVACFLMVTQNETILRWVITLIVALLFLVLGGLSLFDYIRQKND